MRYLRYLFLFVLSVCLLTMAFANGDPVTLRLFPDEIAQFVGIAPETSLPLYMVIFGAIVAGVALGFIWEWLREYKIRASASAERRARMRLEKEVTDLRGPDPKGGEDILEILEDRAPRTTLPATAS